MKHYEPAPSLSTTGNLKYDREGKRESSIPSNLDAIADAIDERFRHRTFDTQSRMVAGIARFVRQWNPSNAGGRHER